MILRIEHLVGAGETSLVERPHVQFPDGDESLEDVRAGVRIRLMQHSLVSGTGSTRLVGIDTGYDDNLVRHLVLDRTEAADIIDNRVFVVRGAWAYYKDQFVRTTIHHILYLLVVQLFGLLTGSGNRIHLLDALGLQQSPFLCHVHNLSF